jgi:hypothetical protein
MQLSRSILALAAGFVLAPMWPAKAAPGFFRFWLSKNYTYCMQVEAYLSTQKLLSLTKFMGGRKLLT